MTLPIPCPLASVVPYKHGGWATISCNLVGRSCNALANQAKSSRVVRMWLDTRMRLELHSVLVMLPVSD
jgi:hypothetical protein